MRNDALPQPIRNHLLPFLREYKDSIVAYTTNTLAGIAWIASSAFGTPSLMYLALGLHTVPASAYYAYTRPYGLQIDITPTVEKNGSREPDKMAEKEGEVILRNRRGTLHAAVDISSYRNHFALEVESPPEILVELRDEPRREHESNRDPLILFGNDITERDFEVVFELYLLDSSSPSHTGYQLNIRDGSSGRTLEKIQAVSK